MKVQKKRAFFLFLAMNFFFGKEKLKNKNKINVTLFIGKKNLKKNTHFSVENKNVYHYKNTKPIKRIK